MKSALLLFLAVSSYCEDVQVNINRWSQVVSERFLSITIDPVSLILAGPLGNAAINLGRGLNPMFVRIGGPNTEKIHFGSGEHNNFSVTTEQWMSVNNFAEEAGVDLIVCLSAMNRIHKVWDSGTALQIISASHSGGYPMSWQFGYDISTAQSIGGDEIGRDLVRLRKILDAFPTYKSAPVLPPGLTSDYPEFLGGMLKEASDVITALPLHLNFSGVEAHEISEEITTAVKLLDQQTNGPSLLLRTVTPPPKAVWIVDTGGSRGDFNDAMLWMLKLGHAARLGVQVVMKQPNLQSLHSPTPDYWASLLHKHLVGRFVLDTRIVPASRNGLQIFSHCTLATNHNTSILDYLWGYEKGAMTAFGVNPAQRSVQVNFKGLSVKEEIVHVYTLTSALPGLSSRETLFNGQKLGLSPRGELPVLSPRVRKVSRMLSLPIPPNSIFFIVFPDLKLRTCMNNVTPVEGVVKRLVPVKAQVVEEVPVYEQPNDVYVSFMKKKRKEVKMPDGVPPVMDLSHRLLQEFNRMAERLGFRKPKLETSNMRQEPEKVKYNFYNDNSWLNRLSEVADNSGSSEIEQKREMEYVKHHDDLDQAKNQKYSLLTSAIFGKEANKSGYMKSMGYLPEQHYRGKRDADGTSISNAEARHNDGFPFKDSIQKVHNFILDYISKVGSKLDPGMLAAPVGIDSLNDFLKNLGQIEVKVGENLIPQIEVKSDYASTENGNPDVEYDAEEATSGRSKRDTEGISRKKVKEEFGTSDVKNDANEMVSGRSKRNTGVWCNKAAEEYAALNPVDLTSEELNCTDYHHKSKRDVSLQQENQDKEVNKYIEKLSSLGEELIKKAEEFPKRMLQRVNSGCPYSGVEGDIKRLCETIQGNNDERNYEYFSKIHNLLNRLSKMNDNADKINYYPSGENGNHNSNTQRSYSPDGKYGQGLKIADSSLETDETMKYHSVRDFVKRANEVMKNRKSEQNDEKVQLTSEVPNTNGYKSSLDEGLISSDNIYENPAEIDAVNLETGGYPGNVDVNPEGELIEEQIALDTVNGNQEGIDLKSDLDALNLPSLRQLNSIIDERLEKKRQQIEELKQKIHEAKEKLREALAKAASMSPIPKHASIQDVIDGLKTQSQIKVESDGGLMEKINNLLQSNQHRAKRETPGSIYEDERYYNRGVRGSRVRYLVPIDSAKRRVVLNNVVYPARLYSIVEDDIPEVVEEEDAFHDDYPYDELPERLPLLDDVSRPKRSLNDDSSNALSKISLSEPNIDEIKIKVEEKFRGATPSLLALAKEYSRLSGHTASPADATKDFTEDTSLEDTLVEDISVEDTFDEDWVNKAERVSPIHTSRRKTKSSRRESKSEGTIISSLIEKLTGLMSFIVQFANFKN